VHKVGKTPLGANLEHIVQGGYGTSGKENSEFSVVLGAQWGDEGKGKLADILAQDAEICCRFNGGSNAGHTLVVEGITYKFHLLPCGMINKKCSNLIGNGVVVHLPTLMREIEQLKDYDANALKRVLISNRAALLLDMHMEIDALTEEEKVSKPGGKIGTTKRGVGPCYSTKMFRNGLRVGDLAHFESFKQKLEELAAFGEKKFGVQIDIKAEIETYRGYANLLKDQIVDTVLLIKKMRESGKKILAEGANAALLDIDFGTYPYVTSSNTTIGAVCTGLGVPPQAVHCSIGVVKAYTTRVGAGPFPTELTDEIGEHFASVGHEFGTTTGRKRRCGWLDLPLVQFSHALNGYASLNITKLDVLTGLKTLKIGVQYKHKHTGRVLVKGEFPDHLEDLAQMEVIYDEMPGWSQDISKCRTVSELPLEAQNYLRKIEEHIECPISWIGVGPDRDDMFLASK